MQRTHHLALALAGALLFAPIAQATIVDHQSAAVDGAERLLDIQFASGAFPWSVGSNGEYQNVQGITAIGLLDAFKVSGDSRYLDGAGETRDWLAANWDAQSSPRYFSASNVYFLVQYALLTQHVDDITFAREAFTESVDRFGGPAETVEYVLDARVHQGHTNLGIWDGALFIRAAQDAGFTDAADEMATTLASSTIVDPFDSSASWYELGLAGFALGLSEADYVTFKDDVDAAIAALGGVQAPDGGVTGTYRGTVYAGDLQATAYAAMAFIAVGDVTSATAACDFLVTLQREDGSFEPSPGSGAEYGEFNSEAVSALSACVEPLPNGALAYADALVAAL